MDLGPLISKNEELVRDLIKSSLTLTYIDDGLYVRVKEDISLLNLYNRINATKYIHGIFNHIEVYKRFKYFHLAHYITSTGRYFTHNYYIQLQSYKLLKGLITLNNQPEVTKKVYEQVKVYMEKLKPEITQDYEAYKIYTQKTLGWYIQSFLKEPQKYKEYPYESALGEQLQWLL